MQSLIDRYHELPRVGKWVVWAVLALAAFLVWDTAAIMTAEYEDRADAAASDIAEYERLLAQRQAGGGALERGLQRHGPVDWVGERSEREPAMLELINAIVEDNAIGAGSNRDFKAVRLRDDAAERLFGSRSVQRLICTFSFDSDPDTMTNVVRQLEASPIVVSVSALDARVIDENAKRLNVRLDVETWVWGDAS